MVGITRGGQGRRHIQDPAARDALGGVVAGSTFGTFRRLAAGGAGRRRRLSLSWRSSAAIGRAAAGPAAATAGAVGTVGL